MHFLTQHSASIDGPSTPRTARIERLMLILSGLFLGVNLISLSLVRGIRAGDWLMLLAWVLCVAVAHYILNNRLPNRDPLLFPLAMSLTGWGLLIIDRLSDDYIYNFADRQTVWMVFGVAALLTVAIRPEPLRWLREYRYLMLTIGLILLVSTIILGTNPSGSPYAPQLWLGFGSIYVQPSELLKIFLVGFLASYLAEQYPALRADGLDQSEHNLLHLSPRIIGPVMLMFGLSVIILVWQRDLGTATLFFGVFLTLLYVASSNIWVIIGGGGLITAAGVLAYQLFAVVRLRVDIWVNPWVQADGNAYQIVQSLMAFASGGVWGHGIGQGTPNYIPVVHSDFVFAALAEEWGLLGAGVVIMSFAIFTMRGLRIAVIQQERPFYALMATGLSTLIALQSIMIIGGTLRLLPLTGVTVPFLSYGGSSLVVSFTIIGLLLRLSEQGQMR